LKKDSKDNIHSSKSNEEVAKFIYNKAIDKFNLLGEIIEQSDITEKYDYEDDYYTIMAYMYIFNYYKMNMIKKYGDENMMQILTNCFQIVSDTLTNPKYKKSGSETVIIFCENILPDFEVNGNNAVRDGKSPFLYMSAVFLNSTFNIPTDVLENNYYEVVEKIRDLFILVYEDKDIHSL
jgi:hypothetical protein